MVAFLALLAKPAIAGLIKWGMGCAVTYFTAKPLVEKWGSTPNNRGSEMGISPQDIYEYSRKAKAEKLEYLKDKSDEKNKELKEENDKLKSEISKLENRLLKETEEWRNEQDTGEKAKKLAILEATQQEVNAAKSQLKQNESVIKKNETEISKLYDELSKGAEKLTHEQIQSKNNSPDLKSWFNWGIISICVIVAVLVVRLVFKIFKSLEKETK